MTESKSPEPAKPIGRWSSFWRRAGQALRALVGAKTGLLIFLALALGCAKGEVSQNIKEFINGFVGAPAVTPTPTPSRPPVVIEPTPTNTPVVIPTATIAPSPTPVPAAGCVPKPPAGPVTLIYRGACPSYMEPLDFEGEGNVNVPGDKKLCAVKAGVGNGRTAWRLGYGLGRQGMRLERFGEVWLQFDSGRGCTDAYGRHFPDCETIYQHPEPDGEFSWGGYVRPVYCEDQPTPAPTAGPTPTPGGSPRGDACSCQVACSVRFLGHNDLPGLPAGVVVGGHATADITCRQAQFPGDQRGQPVDRSNGPEWCEPAENPVLWDVSAPVGFKIGNDGYRLDMSDLGVGSYSIRVTPRPGATYRNGEPVQICSWGHNDSVKTVLEFEVR